MRHLKILSTSDVMAIFIPPITAAGKTGSRRLVKGRNHYPTYPSSGRPDDIILTLENGDWIQGSSFASYLATKDPDQAAIFSKLPQGVNYDAGVLGNHEFNYGLDYLRACEADRNFPLLGANIDGAHAQGIVDAPYQIFEKRGVKIAVLGLTTTYVPVWEPAKHLTD